MLLVSLISFGAIILAWIVAPDGASAKATHAASMPTRVAAARA